jgi:hypothetical protein
MNELSKTLTFVGIAAVIALAAVFLRPTQGPRRQDQAVDRELVKPFAPSAVAGMEIVKFDPRTGKAAPFDVKRVEVHGKPRWSIPSHSNYPADAKDQVVQAAKSLLGLKILGVVSENDADQEAFGAVDPGDKLASGAKGVGTRVTLTDQAGKVLLALVIGDEVKGQPGQRYVRLAGKPAIYAVAVQTDALVTDFDRWIEKNLLAISPWDIHRLWLRDYSTALMMDMMAGQLGVDKRNRGEIVLDYDDRGENQWKLVKDLIVNAKNKLVPAKMAADEELNVAKLNDLKTALGDLKIVDVVRKPPGLSADLKASADFTGSDESVMTLMQRGFVAVKAGTLYSKEGEVRCAMKDGVEYVLRFGNIAEDKSGAAAKPAEVKDKKKGAEDKTPVSLNRYLFVMAEFNPEAIEKPKLDPLPTPTAFTKNAEKSPAGAEEKKPAAPEKKPADAAKKPDASAAAKKAPAEKIPNIDWKALQAETDRVKKDNLRKQDEYNTKIEEGKKRVEELNDRFADWYYIISDAEYRKILLPRSEVIKKKEKKEDSKDAAKLPPTMPQLIPGMKPAGK